MKNYTTFVRMRSGNHIGDAKMSKKGTSLHRTGAVRIIVESGKNVTFFEQLFCFYQLVLVVWNTFGAKFKLPFISWVKQNWHFLWQWRKKLPFPHFGGLLGETGVREKSFLRSRVQPGLHDSPLSTRSPYHLYSFSGVRHVCHDNDGWFVYADPRIPGYKH